jgi:hypothetical protein
MAAIGTGAKALANFIDDITKVASKEGNPAAYKALQKGIDSGTITPEQARAIQKTIEPTSKTQDTPLSNFGGSAQGERKLLPEPALEGTYEPPSEVNKLVTTYGSPLETATPVSNSTAMVPVSPVRGRSTDFVGTQDGQVGRGGETAKAQPRNLVEKLPEQKLEEKGINLKGLAAGTLGTALAAQADTSEPAGQMFPNLPKMDVKGTPVSEAVPAQAAAPTEAPKPEKKQKSAPANAEKRTAAAQESFQEGVDKIAAASENAPNEEARKRYDATLSKLNSLKTRIDAFDSKERQILAYERIGDMLARAFANLGAGLTAAKQGVTVNPLKLEAADQAARYADLQALSKQRYADLGEERDLATKSYTQELKSIEDKNREKFDRDKLAKQESENQKDRDLRWQIANLEKASRESIAGGRGTSEQFKVDKEIFDSADRQVQLREKEKQQILSSKKLPKTLTEAMGVQFPDLEGDSTALLGKWLEIQDGLIYQAKAARTAARDRLQGSPELEPASQTVSVASGPKAGKVIVSNGKETFEVNNPEDLEAAKKEGFKEVK